MGKKPSSLKREKWQKICKDWQMSGLGPKRYCEEKNIGIEDFFRWRKKINFPFLKRSTLQQEKWQRICKDWQMSGLGPKRYCEEKNIGIEDFFRWRKKINFPFLKRPKRIIHGWDKIIANWEKSNVSVSKYCEKENLPPGVFYSWRRKFHHSSSKDLQQISKKWEEIVTDWEASGLTMHAYSMKNAFGPSSLRQWEKKLRPHKVRQTSQEKTLKKWTKIMEEWQMSGLSGFAYCQKNGIQFNPFQKWKKKLNFLEPSHLRLDVNKQEYAKVDLEDYFVSIPFSSANILRETHPTIKKIEVVLPQGHQLRIEGQFDEEGLSLYLDSLLQPKNNQ